MSIISKIDRLESLLMISGHDMEDLSIQKKNIMECEEYSAFEKKYCSLLNLKVNELLKKYL